MKTRKNVLHCVTVYFCSITMEELDDDPKWNYKKLHEKFISNNNGTTAQEILYVGLAPHMSLIFYALVIISWKISITNWTVT
jgi:hypothetical protein